MKPDRCQELKIAASTAHIVAGVMTMFGGLAQAAADSGDEEGLIGFVKAAELKGVRDLMDALFEVVKL